MANVTIKLTVDTVAVLNNPKEPALGTNCWLSQAGGEDIGNYIVVDTSNSEENISHVTENDVITWVGMPADGNSANQIDITAIHKDGTGGSVLGNPLETSWAFGKTIIRQVVQAAPGDNKETYTINFSISAAGESIPFSFDPKIRVHPSH
jgi:hypothetical protein